jgi:hypothetical protein
MTFTEQQETAGARAFFAEIRGRDTWDDLTDEQHAKWLHRFRVALTAAAAAPTTTT